MKKRQLQDFKAKTVEELTRELKSLHDKKLSSQAAIVSGKEKNLKVVRHIRRDIAQVLSIIHGKGEK